MTALFSFPHRTNIFSSYKPSKNAHLDFLPPNGSSFDASMAPKENIKHIHLTLKSQKADIASKQELRCLLASIAPLLAGQATEQSFHHLSSTCHKLVLPPHTLGPTIYSRVKEEIEASVASHARELRGSILSKQEGWLSRLISGWNDWEKRVHLLSNVFVYLDRIYSNESNGVSSIRDLAVVTFRKGIWENELLFGKTKDDLITWVTGEREDNNPNLFVRNEIVSLTALSKLLKTYDTLTNPYLALTASYYRDSSEKLLSNSAISPIQYIEWVLEQTNNERERAEMCFSRSTAKDVVAIMREEAGRRVSTKVVRPALDQAMDNFDIQALGRLNYFAIKIGVFDQLVTALRDHIEDRLRKLISDPANDSQMIEGILTLKRFADRAVRSLHDFFALRDLNSFEQSAFPTDLLILQDVEVEAQDMTAEQSRNELRSRDLHRIELEDAIRVGCKAGMGSRQNAPAEWIAKHLDVVMRRGQGSGTEAEFNALLDEIIALIGFTKDKDVFKAFYSTQLAKRLLLNKSASDDMERNMIVKLQREMGEEFTSGDIMMKDLQLSETLVKSYQAARLKTPDEYKDPGNLTANVLTESAWPAYPQLKKGWDFKLTPELQSSIDAFTSWYATQHRNRQLSWRHQLATVTLSGRFSSGKYEMGVSLFQAVVMLQFNDDDNLTFEEIKERTGIESSELVRTLQSLSMGRKGTRVLAKRPPGKAVLPTDTFSYNKTFTSDRIKFKINQIQQDLSAEESRKTNEQVAVDRVSVLEATIVRIMKGKKKSTLQLLIDQVVSDVSKRFPPDVKEIKKRVENLIEREFLMRDEEDRNTLHYLA